MAISRPTAADPEFPHNGKSVRISQREGLVGELLHDAACLGQLGSVEPRMVKPGLGDQARRLLEVGLERRRNTN
jgi:hypothetical protein